MSDSWHRAVISSNQFGIQARTSSRLRGVWPEKARVKRKRRRWLLQRRQPEPGAREFICAGSRDSPPSLDTTYRSGYTSRAAAGVSFRAGKHLAAVSRVTRTAKGPIDENKKRVRAALSEACSDLVWAVPLRWFCPARACRNRPTDSRGLRPHPLLSPR